MNYLQYWKLHSPPFHLSSSDLYLQGSVEEAEARLRFLGESRRGLGILVGPDEVGKSSLLKYLDRHRGSRSPATAPTFIYQSLLGRSPVAIYMELASRLGEGWMDAPIPSTYPKRPSVEQAWLRLHDCLVATKVANSRVVLMFDDVADADEGVIDALRRLLAIAEGPTLLLAVDSRRLERISPSLMGRCQLKIELPPWDLGQTANYFEWTLERAAAKTAIFDAQSITRIHELSEGLPHRINRLADLMLIAGAGLRLPRLSSELCEQVFEELSFAQGGLDRIALSR